MGDESEDELRKGFRPILDVMVDAAINMCLSVSDARQTQKAKADWDGDIFVLNCLTHLIVSIFAASNLACWLIYV